MANQSANRSIDAAGTAGRTGFSAMRLLPIVAGIVLVALILWVQFGAPFGKNGFFVNISARDRFRLPCLVRAYRGVTTRPDGRDPSPRTENRVAWEPRDGHLRQTKAPELAYHAIRRRPRCAR